MTNDLIERLRRIAQDRQEPEDDHGAEYQPDPLAAELMEEAAQALQLSQQREERLREALKPFARCEVLTAEFLPDSLVSSQTFIDGPAPSAFERARQALKETQ